MPLNLDSFQQVFGEVPSSLLAGWDSSTADSDIYRPESTSGEELADASPTGDVFLDLLLPFLDVSADTSDFGEYRTVVPVGTYTYLGTVGVYFTSFQELKRFHD